MNEKKIIGLKNAPPEKRYKSFLNAVADSEEVWLLESEDGIATYDSDGFIHVMVWPNEIFCKDFIQKGETTRMIEVHDFIEQCQTLDDNINFMVFPTDENGYIVSRDKLCFDLMEHLAEVE